MSVKPPGPRASLRSLVLAACLSGLAVLAACTSASSPAAPAPPAPCDSSKCKPGNSCLTFEGETKCRKTCGSNWDPSTSCPFGYTCTDTETGEPPFCVEDTALNGDGARLVEKPGAQWGVSCAANLGLESPPCDTAQGFYCYGTSPTDGDAYCTRYGCSSDRDCGAGFWCAKVNSTPNVATAKRKAVGEVQSVCLRRTYCATCAVDLDCPPVEGRAQHCVPDEGGSRVCMPECDTSRACRAEARCADVGLGAKVCYPRAGVCVGDGSICSPCRADTDCGEDGICVKGRYTTERVCAKKSTKPCGENEDPPSGSCPSQLEGGSKSRVACFRAGTASAAADYCVGLYAIGAEGDDIGCWTPNRK